jgi:hypothetical protein
MKSEGVYIVIKHVRIYEEAKKEGRLKVISTRREEQQQQQQ